MKKVVICLLFISCQQKSEYEVYKEKYDSTLNILDTQIRLSQFYLDEGRKNDDSSYFLLADSCALEAEKSVIRANELGKKISIK